MNDWPPTGHRLANNVVEERMYGPFIHCKEQLLLDGLNSLIYSTLLYQF